MKKLWTFLLVPLVLTGCEKKVEPHPQAASAPASHALLPSGSIRIHQHKFFIQDTRLGHEWRGNYYVHKDSGKIVGRVAYYDENRVQAWVGNNWLADYASTKDAQRAIEQQLFGPEKEK